VPKEGLEPSHPKAQEPKSCVSTSSTTPALFNCLARQARSCLIASLASSLGADSPWSAPTSSSLADEKHVPSLLVSTARGAIRFSLLRFASPQLFICQKRNTKNMVLRF
jgi:hypothetical protein